jgi:hypothetical protein
MTKKQKREHKLFNLLRFGYRQGWVIPREKGEIVISQSAPGYFHDRLKKFEKLFIGERA